MSQPLSDFRYGDFVRARKLHWKQEAKSLGSEIEVPDFQQIELGGDDSNFIISSRGPNGVFGVFEDANDTGWLYLFDANRRAILRCLPVYNRSNVAVEADDVIVTWSKDEETCSVAVWDQMRAFLGISNGVEMKKAVLNRESHGFYTNEWPDGFAHLLLKAEN